MFEISTHGIYETDGHREPVLVVRYTDVAGQTLPDGLLPYDLEAQAAFAVVRRNAGHGPQHLVDAGRLHTDGLGRCDLRRITPTEEHRAGRRYLTCLTHGVSSEDFVPAEVTA